ncbi:hypothetical protein GCM10009613_09550 [Pseudonocardia kongjuensis]|uniref:Uncharacterized protein n=1 Tax=Pseudonocardia kongjuensis TaxID=102227 RepID=A0ABN1XHY5_9PSEU
MRGDVRIRRNRTVAVPLSSTMVTAEFPPAKRIVSLNETPAPPGPLSGTRGKRSGARTWYERGTRRDDAATTTEVTP